MMTKRKLNKHVERRENTIRILNDETMSLWITFVCNRGIHLLDLFHKEEEGDRAYTCCKRP